jgi:adenylate cyclase
MPETRKLAAILAADVAGYSTLAGADEERTLARLRALRSDLFDPTVALHHGRVVKRTGDGVLLEFRSVVDAVRCAIEVQNGMVERNAGLPPERRIEFRVGIHLGDVVEESDGDLMGDGVNIAARLEGIAKPGTICLSEDAYRQVKSRLDVAVRDLGANQLKNISEPVHVYSVEVGQQTGTKPTKPIARRKSPLIPAGAGFVALVAIAAGAWYFFDASRPSNLASNKPAHLSIVVLPFTNISGDSGQDYFADGITENLTTELSRIRNSFVIARNTAFTFKGKNIPVKEVSKELGVRYVLEGSVQRDQNRVRVNAQLIDGDTGTHLWADRFEESVADLFKLQDEVVTRLAATLGRELVRAEAKKGASSKTPDAIDLTMRGWALMMTPPVPLDKNTAARTLFDQSLSIEPYDADALAGKAYTYLIESLYWPSPDIDYDAKILNTADRAIALAGDTLWAYYVKSQYLTAKRPDEALAAANAGMAVNPNFAPIRGTRGSAEMYLGHFEQAKSDLLQAIRLSPRDPLRGAWHCTWRTRKLVFGILMRLSRNAKRQSTPVFVLFTYIILWPLHMRSQARWKRRSLP